MLKNNYEILKDNLDKAFLSFIDYGKDEDFSFEAMNKKYELTKDNEISYMGLQADGIVDEKCYKQAKKKILILLYESYRRKGEDYNYIWNLAKNLKDSEFKPYGKVRAWLKEINKGLNLNFDESIDPLSYCAVMNISKIGRTVISPKDKETVLNACVRSKESERKHKFVPYCGEKLAEQFLSYKPDIVICGNTKSYMDEFLRTKAGLCQEIIDSKWKVEEKTRYGKPRLSAHMYKIEGQDMLVFWAYHPASNLTKTEDFKNIIEKNNLKI